ncbi:N-acyl homoserine lactonase family protein [Thioalkalivibrio nitratireducens]|uniref:N-acyl homoserine lactonase family protein n=1 Tax=Thioalkalivibrio nitratireducens TaxID=186931 RepID=UPI000693584D|nr:N-acyl homoserine lactonase family protein [Thioalkalivibrio nitratireducens]
MWWVLFSRNWVEVPLNVFVLEHPKGLILFDAGLDTAVLTNPTYVDSRIGRFFMRRLFRLKMRAEETITNKLAGLGFDAADVRKVVVSHLHFDHVGGIAEVPQADLLVSRNEWAQLSGPHPERDFIFGEHVQRPGARWQVVDFEHTHDPLLAPFGGCHDVMNDGSLILLPTPGHTPGSISMLARIKGRAPVLLIGDLAYEAELLMKDQLPGTGNKAQLIDSYEKVRDLKQHLPELVILPSHDFAAQEYLSSSPAQQGAPADRSTAARFSVG